MAATFVGVLAKVIIGHVGETEPDGEGQASSPREHHAPPYPIGNAENQADFFRPPLIAQDVGGADTPDEGRRPDHHDKKAFAARIAQELLFLASGFVAVLWHGS